VNDVKLLARWTGWCDPCETERPLVLTETGERGISAWLRGVGPEDRNLRLTCLVCGEWQDVPLDEPDVEELARFDLPPIVAVRPVGTRQIVLTDAPTRSPYAVYPLPAPRPTTDDPDAAFELMASDLDLISIAG
jgi:hypothetical protein